MLLYWLLLHWLLLSRLLLHWLLLSRPLLSWLLLSRLLLYCLLSSRLLLYWLLLNRLLQWRVKGQPSGNIQLPSAMTNQIPVAALTDHLQGAVCNDRASQRIRGVRTEPQVHLSVRVALPRRRKTRDPQNALMLARLLAESM